MTVYSVYIINRAGGLIYQLDHANPKTEVEKTFSYPLELTLKIMDERVVVAFGQRDGIHGKYHVLCRCSAANNRLEMFLLSCRLS